MVELTDLVDERAYRRLQVSHNANIRVDILADFRRIDVHVDDARFRSEVFEAAGYAVVEAHAQRDEQVGAVHGPIGVDVAVHTNHTE